MKTKLFASFVCVMTLMGSALGHTAATTEGRSDLMQLGQSAPDFNLTDVVTGQKVSRDQFVAKKALVVLFICKHCPFVQRIKGGLAQLSKDYEASDAAIVAISSNDASFYPEDGPASLKQMAMEEGFRMPFLYDETQEVGKTYTAIATPDVFVFDANRKLVYRGQFDDARPGNDKLVTGESVRAAMDAVLAGTPVPADQKPAIGWGIKWKKGNAPAYPA